MQGLIIATGFLLHNYIEWQMKIIVYTFCQLILARVDNCNWIFIAQLYRKANESNSIYILSTYFARLIIATGFLLHNYIEWQMKVTVYTFCQPILQGLYLHLDFRCTIA